MNGKVAIISGAATGIGRSVALGLAELGWNIVLGYSRSEREANETASEVGKRGGAAIVVKGDVASDADCRATVEAAVRAWNRVDALVNSAGATVFVPHSELDALTADSWDRVFAVNVRGVFQMARAAAAALRASGAGSIVNISSTAGTTGVGSSIPYAASKAALDNLTITLARTLAPAVRVNGVAPGFVESRWVEGYGERIAAMRKLVKQHTPLRDTAQPEHVAEVVIALVTGMRWVTGETIVVDGGFTIRG